MPGTPIGIAARNRIIARTPFMPAVFSSRYAQPKMNIVPKTAVATAILTLFQKELITPASIRPNV